MAKDIRITSSASSDEQEHKALLSRLIREAPIPDAELSMNSGLFVRRQELQKVLFLDDLYKNILGIHGVIMEFGVRWGQNLVTLSNLRSIYEPYNHNRRIIGFDTFEGFITFSEEDRDVARLEQGAYSTTPAYENRLAQILQIHEDGAPLSHIRKTMLVKGDAPVALQQYLVSNPQTIIALAYFDMDLYLPTKECLQLIEPYITTGSILAFDEMNDPTFPGETIAFKEVFGLRDMKLRRGRHSGMQSYVIIGQQ